MLPEDWLAAAPGKRLTSVLIRVEPMPESDAEVLKLLSDHAAQCDRQYQGGLGLGASFTFSIACRAQPAPPAPRAQEGG